MSTFNIDTVSTRFGSVVDTAQTKLENAGQAVQANPSDAKAMLDYTMAMNTWSNMVNLQSTLVKTIGDTFRGIVQKMP